MKNRKAVGKGSLAVYKIYALQTEGSAFDPRLCQDLNICVTVFPTKALPAFYPSRVNKRVLVSVRS